MEIISRRGREGLALLNIGRFSDGSLVEFVESVQPPVPRSEKWVLIVSTLKGCPVKCLMCDAGGYYEGRLSSAEIFSQIDAMIVQRFPDRIVPIPKFKIQFARMGEPSLNHAVLEVIRELPTQYNAPGLMPCISTVLPRNCEVFFKKLAAIKNDLYSHGRFQLQFSLHTSDDRKRKELIQYPVLDFEGAARLGELFHHPGDRKIALNFAAARNYPVDAHVLRRYFDPTHFLIKITPLNPTARTRDNGLSSQIDPYNGDGSEEMVTSLRQAGYEVILSLGEPEEDSIGSNCGQYINQYRVDQEAMTACAKN